MDRQLSFHGDESGVIATNDDASESKRSCIKLNYYKDDYLHFFCKVSERKAPEINRGYYARVKGIEMCIEKFIQVSFWADCSLNFDDDIETFFSITCKLQKTGDKCQIINLGCGFDTLYWRLRDAGHMIQNFIELDYSTVTAKKCYQIKRSKVLLEKLNVEGEAERNFEVCVCAVELICHKFFAHFRWRNSFQSYRSARFRLPHRRRRPAFDRWSFQQAEAVWRWFQPSNHLRGRMCARLYRDAELQQFAEVALVELHRRRICQLRAGQHERSIWRCDAQQFESARL